MSEKVEMFDVVVLHISHAFGFAIKIMSSGEVGFTVVLW